MDRSERVQLAIAASGLAALVFLVVASAAGQGDLRWVLIPLASVLTVATVISVSQKAGKILFGKLAERYTRSNGPAQAGKESEIKLRYIAMWFLVVPVVVGLVVGLILGNMLLLLGFGILAGLAGFAVIALIGLAGRSSVEKHGQRW